jgi:hypothetical protein
VASQACATQRGAGCSNACSRRCARHKNAGRCRASRTRTKGLAGHSQAWRICAMIGARRWALDGEERTWARGEVSPGSGHARADASLRRPGGVTRERERAVLPDQRLYGKTALQWCPASLRTLPAFNWKSRHHGPAARAALTASSVLSQVGKIPEVHVACQIYRSWRTTCHWFAV